MGDLFASGVRPVRQTTRWVLIQKTLPGVKRPFVVRFVKGGAAFKLSGTEGIFFRREAAAPSAGAVLATGRFSGSARFAGDGGRFAETRLAVLAPGPGSLALHFR